MKLWRTKKCARFLGHPVDRTTATSSSSVTRCIIFLWWRFKFFNFAFVSLQMAIYVTDGAANLDVGRTLAHAIEAKNAGILMIAVSIGLDANVQMLRSLVSRPPEAHLFLAMSSGNLPTMVNDVVDATCNSINECLPNRCQPGSRCIDKVSLMIMIQSVTLQ